MMNHFFFSILMDNFFLHRMEFRDKIVLEDTFKRLFQQIWSLIFFIAECQDERVRKMSKQVDSDRIDWLSLEMCQNNGCHIHLSIEHEQNCEKEFFHFDMYILFWKRSFVFSAMPNERSSTFNPSSINVQLSNHRATTIDWFFPCVCVCVVSVAYRNLL